MIRFTTTVAVSLLAFLATSCGSDTDVAAATGCFEDPGLSAVQTSSEDLSGTSITLMTHDSFFVSEGLLDSFTETTGIEVTQVAAGDAGQLVTSAVLTAGNPAADVMFGVDNTFMCRALEADVFVPYESAVGPIVEGLTVDPLSRLTPIDYGDVCVNYWKDELPGDAPTSLADLADPANTGQFVTENPETSSPGFAFLLATIAEYGEDGWEQYWADLVDNDVEVTAGWNDAYYASFTAGGGPRSIVTSYASSPPAEFLFADPPVDAPPTDVLTASCYRQVEYAGILNGTEHPAAAAQLIDFMLSPAFQNDIPLNMFVYPVNADADLPQAFVDFTATVDTPLSIDPETIEANRDDWTRRWNDVVFG